MMAATAGKVLLEVVGGKTLEAFAGKAVDWFLSTVGNQIAKIRNCDEEVDKLRRTLERIHCVLVDAEQRRDIEDDFVKHWLLGLKNAAFDAEDLLDRYNTLTKCKIFVKSGSSVDGGGSDSSKMDEDESRERKRKRPDAASGEEPSYDLSSEIKAINERLDEIYKSRKEYRLDAADGRRRSSTATGRPFTPAVSAYNDNSIIGRKNEKQIVVGRLILEHAVASSIPVVALCGVGGIGKTVLAQLAFDDSVLQNYFDKRIWVSVPDGASVERITREIIEAIRGRRPEILSLNLLQEKLRGLLIGSKFLLVLDNLTLEDNFFWETLQLPLLEGSPGSKVLVTTRSTVVCRGMALLGGTIDVPGLGVDDGWELIHRGAFPNGGLEGFEDLEEIGKKMVARCQGSPLVAKSLGITLQNEFDDREWESLLGQMGPLRDNKGDVLSSLMISYRHLDYELKKCFAYCSVLPRGFEFCKGDLVRLWIAEGLVKPSGRRRLDAIGGNYFNELFWRLYFEKCGREREKYRMPGLIHDLARVVSMHETLIFDNDSLLDDVSEDKLGYRYGCAMKRLLDLEKIYDFQRLRTLFTFSDGSRVQVKNISAISTKLKYLRVLNLGYSDIQELSDSVGNFIQLRYLGLSNTDIEVLPESVCNLYNLQTINLSECYNFRKLPDNLSNLVNLMHIALDLQWDRIVSLESMPSGIGSIKSLETLSRFTVTKDKSEYNINELGILELRGELCICKLETITKLSVAEEAKLQEKKYIDKLMLQWTKDVERTNFEKSVAEKLSPHRRLKTLWFKDYPASKFPSWVGEESFKLLEELTLSGCINCTEFPHLHNLPRLKKLNVIKMDSLERLATAAGAHFPMLEIITIIDMLKLTTWFRVEAGTFPKLQRLEIVNCPNLRLNIHDLKEQKHFPSDAVIEIQSSPHVVENGPDAMNID